MVRVTQVLEAHVLGEGDWIAGAEICEICEIEADALRELAALGVVAARESTGGLWELPATALPRLRVAARLMRDLGVNVSGAALALELLETQRELESRILKLERLVRDY